MINRLKSLHYNKELIHSILSNQAGAVATNILGPFLYFSIFKDSMPLSIIISWMLLQFFIFISRLRIGNQLLSIIDTATEQEIKQKLITYLFFIFFNSFLWGISTSLALIYSDATHVFILIAAIFGILAGSIATLSAVFHASFIYSVTIIVISSLSFIFIGAQETYYYTAAFLIIYISVVLPTSFKVYNIMNNSIMQKEKISQLNENLEIKVANAIKETEKKEKLLQQQSRLAQMGEMISMIAHQWRQPLGAISSALMGVQTKLSVGKFDLNDEQGREDFLSFLNKKHENISNYVQVLTTTIDDFRDFFKPDKAMEEIELHKPIERAIQIVKNSMHNKGIEIKTNFTTNQRLPLFENEMMQVVLNILKNSEDNFLEKINHKTIDGIPTITIHTLVDDKQLIIRITDNGGGIPNTILSKIFDPYFSTKVEKDGTGLGLYMSKIMVEEHNNGQFLAHNIENGICFEITFPDLT